MKLNQPVSVQLLKDGNMKNLLIHLKEETHQRALLTVLIMIMCAILFFLLTSWTVPLQRENTVVESDLIEVMVDLSTFNQSEADPSSRAHSLNTSATVLDNEMIVDKVVINKPTGVVADPSLSFSTTDNEKNGIGEFGKTDGVIQNNKGLINTTRSILKHPEFNTIAGEEGTIAVQIWVDENGNVVKTQQDVLGSNSGNQYLIDMAFKAAKTMKYSKDLGNHNTYVGVKLFTFEKK